MSCIARMQTIIGVRSGYPASGIDVMHIPITSGIDGLNCFQRRSSLRALKRSQCKNDGIRILRADFLDERDVVCLECGITDVVSIIIRSQIYDYDIRLVTREIPVRRIGEVDRLHFEELAAHTNARRCTQRAIGETYPTLSDLRVFYLQLLTH